MIFYAKETAIGLALASLPALVSLYFFFVKDQKKTGVGFLFLTALCLRLLIIQVDPYIHDWDERFHALVAKNMIVHPFKPTLIAHPVLSYDVKNWANNHIWVHKQPVFLWQMALSMKLFGVTPFAVRLPSAILGVLMIYMVYDTGRKWLKSETVGYIGAFLATFSRYTLELTSGLRSLEHNDLVFTVYLFGTCWAFVNYTQSHRKWNWALVIGILSGLAILNKWLVGILIYGGWALYLILSLPKIDRNRILHFGFSVLVTCVVFLPWQFYILHAFPLESAAAYESNRTHMIHDLGHPGSNWYHVLYLPVAYHLLLLIFLLVGLIRCFYQQHVDRKLSIAFIAMVVVIFGFFSIMVQTRMPSFVFPVSGLIFLLMGLGVFEVAQWITSKRMMRYQRGVVIALTLIAGVLALKPGLIIKQRSATNEERNKKIGQFHFFKSLDDKTLEDYVVFNCKRYDNIDLMFYKDATAYFEYPNETTVDSLQKVGYKLAFFEFASQPLPDYIVQDSSVLILEKDLRYD